MSYEFRTSRRADRQIRTAAAWWRENRPKAPEAFIADLGAAFEIISVLPSAGEPVRQSTIPDLRRILLGTSQYFLYYVVNHEQQIVEVLALWHTSRGSEPSLR